MHLFSKLLVLFPLSGIQTTVMAAAEAPMADIILFKVLDCTTTGTVAQTEVIVLPKSNQCVNFPPGMLPNLSYKALLSSAAPKGKTCDAILYRDANCVQEVSDSGPLTTIQSPCIEAIGTKSAILKCD